MIARVISTEESVIYNQKIYGYNEEFEIADEIGKSLIERGLIAGVEEEIDDLAKMSYPELKSYASELGLSAKGTKDELIARIKEHFASEPENEDEPENEGSPNTSMPE